MLKMGSDGSLILLDKSVGGLFCYLRLGMCYVLEEVFIVIFMLVLVVVIE